VSTHVANPTHQLAKTVQPAATAFFIEDAMTQSAVFEDFYRQHYGRLAGSLRLVCGDIGVAEELAQEAFIRAYSRWDRVSKTPDPAGWLFRTGFNLSNRRWRSAARRRSSVGVDESQLGTVDGPNSDRAELIAALGRLPVKQRGAVVARHVLGYSTEEAAELLGMSPANLRTTLHRATAALRLDPSFLATR
jgi:RNA polymerase sigma-70 factor, ECF subfamily